ncbi:Pentatricopeptide repeat-containing protein [Sesamum alatum]|uniref:Pentatricopeptide repeat-containing protein n=1 Tax=Sesamum alatum TaxID=300844 RepID=A0AAE1Y0C1_9LAMI|nr:Pentatricopeptide repeat-containing protein [Sesamum alatum]
MSKLKLTYVHSRKPPPPLVIAAATATTKSFNATISRLSSQGFHRQVLLTFTSMLKSPTATPDAFTYPSLLKACTSLSLYSLGPSLHQQIIVNGFASDPYISCSLINFYAKLNNIGYARKVFDLMPQRNVVPWTAIVGCYSHAGDMRNAFLMYNSMQYEGIRPCPVSILNLLSGICESGHVSALHACVIKYGYMRDIVLVNCLLSVYAKSGRVEDARELFGLLAEKDIVSWNSLINAYSIMGNLNEVLKLFSRMRVENIEPDQQTFGSLVATVAREGSFEVGKVVHGQIVSSGFELDKHVGTSLVALYSRCRKVDDALQIFERAADKDIVFWTAMISALVQNDSADEALRVFRELLVSSAMPSSATMACILAACAQLAILSACSHNGLVDSGMMLFESMKNDHKIEPTIEHCACVVDLLCRAGKVQDAYAFYRKMFAEPMVDVLGILLDACRNCGQEELGHIIAKEISELWPADAGKYVQLAHSFASMARWDGVGEAWSQMRSLGLRKLPGWSFIEMHGTITPFFTRQSSHPEYANIVSMLKNLTDDTKEVISTSEHEEFALDSYVL